MDRVSGEKREFIARGRYAFLAYSAWNRGKYSVFMDDVWVRLYRWNLHARYRYCAALIILRLTYLSGCDLRILGIEPKRLKTHYAYDFSIGKPIFLR